MKYPLGPEYFDSVPNKLVELYEDFEADILRDICRRLKLSGAVTESALNQIRQLQRNGYSLPYIERRIRQILEISRADLNSMFEDAVERNEAFLRQALDKSDILDPGIAWRESLISQTNAIRDQTNNEFRNITRSLGFAIRISGRVKFYGVAEAYQKVLDLAAIEVSAGALDYNTAIRNAIKRLTDSGLQTIYYASGWHNRVDVAVRRAVMTGVSQVSMQYSEKTMEALGTRYVETTAHSGARDVDGPKGWENHKKWQGLVYYWSRGGEPDPTGEYPDLVSHTGYRDVTGLCGANCRHMMYAFVPGVSQRTYTDEELKNIDPPPFKYKGRKYTAYEATQKQRQIETALRKYKRELLAYDAAGQTEAYQQAATRYRRLSAEYKSFSKAAGLRTQQERLYVSGFGQKHATAIKKQ